MPEAIISFWSQYGSLLMTGTRDTLLMTLGATLLSYLVGLPVGALLVVTRPHSIWPRPIFNRMLGWTVNILRSMPFIILIVAIIPFTRAVAGTVLGVRGAIVPLVVAASPFVARMVEGSLSEVDMRVVETVQAMGATTRQLIFKVLLPEAVPSLVRGSSVSVISILAYTAIAGAVGAGGLGDIAVRYGYQRFQTDVMWVTVLLLVILVQVIQTALGRLARTLDKRIR